MRYAGVKRTDFETVKSQLSPERHNWWTYPVVGKPNWMVVLLRTDWLVEQAKQDARFIVLPPLTRGIKRIPPRLAIALGNLHPDDVTVGDVLERLTGKEDL